MYKMVFDDYATGEKNGQAAIEGPSVKASLLMLGVEEEQIEKRFARFVASEGNDRTLADLDLMTFREWLELARVHVG